MFGLMLIVSNPREKQVLKLALEQRGIKVLVSEPNYANFLKSLQYAPDAIIMEYPHECVDQMHFTGLIRKHKKTKGIPILGYGEDRPEPVKKGLIEKGARNYYTRPLKFSNLLLEIQSIAQQKKKTIEVKTVANEKDADISAILSTETLPLKKIELMVKHVSNLMAFPFTVAKVMQLSENSKSGANDLSKAVESDPVITASILKVSNTVFFAALNRKINSIKDAIVRIGFRETKRIVMGMTVMKMFKDETNSFGFDRADFWYHSLACAVIAENIGRRMGSVSPEEAFLAGLLHDFGIIVLDEFFPTIFGKVLERTTDEGSRFIDKETAMLGVNHNDVIAELFKAWKMPDAITEGVVGQYQFHTYKDACDTPGKRIALCVALADALSKSVHLGKECDQFVTPIENWVFETVKLPTGFTPAFLDAVYHDINMFRQFLGLDDRRAAAKETEGAEKSRKIYFVNSANHIFVPPVFYLKEQGFEVEAVQPKAPPAQINSQYDMSVVWTDLSATEDVIRPFTEIIKNGADLTSAAVPEFAPVLALVHHDSRLPDSAQLKNVTYLRHGFDLREMEKRVMLTMSPAAPAAPDASVVAG